MKLILSILCGTVILFVGGCVLNFSDGGPITIAAWAVVVVNLLMIVAMWANIAALKPVFIGMAVLDIGVALFIGGVSLTETGNDRELLLWGLAAAAAFVVKAGLSFAVSRRV